MKIKKSLGSFLKRSADTIISKNTTSCCTCGAEDMPEVLKKTR